MIDALWISVIGMGLVFLAILFLWGLMVALVWLTNERTPTGEPERRSEIELTALPDLDSKRRAAAVAVAVAVALRNSSATRRDPETHETVSPWQAIHRASLLAQRAHLPRRKESS